MIMAYEVIIINLSITISILFLIVSVYIISKSTFIYIRQHISPFYKLSPFKHPVRILSYNIQRLPYLFRPNIDIEKLLTKYDIICLQENFCSIFGTNKYHYKYNYDCIQTATPFYKLIDSGICIYSKLPIIFIDFKQFTNSHSVDYFADKGFLVVQIGDTVVVNTHLQSTYTFNTDYRRIAIEQLSSISEYCKQFKKVIIVGDFNVDLISTDLSGYNKLVSNIPTHWNKMQCIFNQSSATQKDSTYLPFFYDGAFYKNITLTEHTTEQDDLLTDHLGVSFNCQLSEF